MYTNADITIYNRIPQRGTGNETYQRLQIQNVFLSKTQEIIQDGNAIKKADIIKILIPKESLNSIDKIYRNPKEFINTVDKTNYYTFNTKDIIVKGLVEDDIATPKTLSDNYNDVYNIISVADNRYGSEEMQHFNIKAK